MGYIPIVFETQLTMHKSVAHYYRLPYLSCILSALRKFLTRAPCPAFVSYYLLLVTFSDMCSYDNMVFIVVLYLLSKILFGNLMF